MDIQEKQKIALVCSGGAVKAAAFHVGVVLAMQEKGFTFMGGLKPREAEFPKPPFKAINTYVGSSAGAFITGCLAAGYPVASLIKAFGRENKTFENISKHAPDLKALTYSTLFAVEKSPLRRIKMFFKKQPYSPPYSRFIGFEALLRKALRTTGFFSTKGIEEYLREHVLPTNHFEELSSELHIVATQLNHSRKVIFCSKELRKSDTIHYSNFSTVSDAIAASMSLPPVFEPFQIKNQKGVNVDYLDGEIRETLSTHVAKDAGADLIFISYTHQPYHFHKEIGSLTQYGLPAICVQALYQAIEQKISASRRRKNNKFKILDTVSEFFEKENLSQELKKKMLNELEHVMGFKRNIDYVYIHPKARDYEMFFGDHFSLNPDYTERIVRIGFRSALAALREHGL